jgi:hypothetical protein
MTSHSSLEKCCPSKLKWNGESVTHACNPGYSGGRGQEHLGSKSTLREQFMRSYVKKAIRKRAGNVTQDITALAQQQ